MTESAGRFRYPASHRLHGRLAFAAVFEAKMRKSAGPLALHAKPNGLDYLRTGLSVSRRVGKAVTRNRIKRLLREAIRLTRHNWPGGYDLVIVVRPHAPMKLTEYQRLLTDGITTLDRQWQKRLRNQTET